jgi:chromosome segregation ATPase
VPSRALLAPPDTAEVAALAQKLAQAEQQLAAAKARILNLEDEIAALRGALAHERKRHAAKPKAEKPAPTPDEARDRQIKALKTRMRNIMSELHAAREWRRGGLDGGRHELSDNECYRQTPCG